MSDTIEQLPKLSKSKLRSIVKGDEKAAKADDFI
jgi:hypothetical protein